jgi:two-component system OmpR family response regulator
VARRYSGNPNPGLALNGNVLVDRARRVVQRDGRDVLLTSREWAVLDNLADRPGAIVAKDRLEEALYAFGAEVESNTVEVYISRLRKKLGAPCVVTVRGVGYRLGTPA